VQSGLSNMRGLPTEVAEKKDFATRKGKPAPL
jgi:hypothetical protein